MASHIIYATRFTHFNLLAAHTAPSYVCKEYSISISDFRHGVDVEVFEEREDGNEHERDDDEEEAEELPPHRVGGVEVGGRQFVPRFIRDLVGEQFIQGEQNDATSESGSDHAPGGLPVRVDVEPTLPQHVLDVVLESEQ